jgi:hypothetical protein
MNQLARSPGETAALPQVLGLEEIGTIEAANRFLAQTYIEARNARFAVAPQEEETAFVPFVGDLGAILCVKHDRTVGNDNCIRFGKLDLQIPEQRHRRHYVRVTAEVARRLADYTVDGVLVSGETNARSAA